FLFPEASCNNFCSYGLRLRERFSCGGDRLGPLPLLIHLGLQVIELARDRNRVAAGADDALRGGDGSLTGCTVAQRAFCQRRTCAALRFLNSSRAPPLLGDHAPAFALVRLAALILFVSGLIASRLD